jgi:hypothetical protein
MNVGMNSYFVPLSRIELYEITGMIRSYRKVNGRHTAAPFSFARRLKEIDMFFQGKDPVHQTMRRLARRFQRVGIAYAVVGGMAVNAHRYRRTTGDVDFLITARGFAEFQKRFVGRQYAVVPDRPLRFVDRTNDVVIDLLITGAFPGSGDPGPVAYPNPADVSETIDKISVVDLVTLIQLKLAAHRHKDFGDVVELIGVNELDADFADRLHSSLRRDFIECLEEKRREDDYAARRKPPPIEPPIKPKKDKYK